MSPLDGLIEALADAVADRVVRRLTSDRREGFIDQTASPLGRRRHIALARKLIACGSSDAAQVGRRYLVRREAVEAHATEQSRKPRTAKAAPVDQLAELRDRYGLERRAS